MIKKGKRDTKQNSVQDVISDQIRFGGLTVLTGLLFVCMNLYYSYVFYHVNSFKLFSLFIIVFITGGFILYKKITVSDFAKANFTKIFPFLIIPIVLSIPGTLINGFTYNYYFPIEFASKTLLAIWCCYLFFTFEKERSLLLFVLFLFISVLYSSGYALFEWVDLYMKQQAKIQNLNPVCEEFSISGIRAKSTFGNINYFAGFLAVLLPLFLFIFIYHLKSRDNFRIFSFNFSYRVFFFIAVFVTALGLFFTQTRAAQGGVVLALLSCGFLWFFFIQHKNIYKYIALVLLVSSLTAILLFFYLVFYTDIAQLYDGSSRFGELLSVDPWFRRFLPWYTAFLGILKSPFWGYGLGSSYSLFFENVTSETLLISRERSFNHVHNEHLEYIQELGFIGYGVILLLIIGIIYGLIRVIKNDDVPRIVRSIAFGCIGGILAFQFHGIFSVAQRMIVTLFPYYTVLAISLFIVARYDENKFFTTLFSKYNGKLSGYLMIILGSVLFLASAYGFYHWSYSLYGFQKINSMKVSRNYKTNEAFQHLTENPNVYSSDNLLTRLMQINQLDRAEKMALSIDSMIPHYRDNDQNLYEIYLRKKDAKKALEYLNRYNERNSYGLNAIVSTSAYNLSKLDTESFFEDAKKYMYSSTIHNVGDYLHYNDIEVVTTEGTNGLVVAFSGTPSDFPSLFNSKNNCNSPSIVQGPKKIVISIPQKMLREMVDFVASVNLGTGGQQLRNALNEFADGLNKKYFSGSNINIHPDPCDYAGIDRTCKNTFLNNRINFIKNFRNWAFGTLNNSILWRLSV